MENPRGRDWGKAGAEEGEREREGRWGGWEEGEIMQSPSFRV